MHIIGEDNGDIANLERQARVRNVPVAEVSLEALNVGFGDCGKLN